VNAGPVDIDGDWPLRVEISRLTTQLASSRAAYNRQKVRANDHAARALRSQAITRSMEAMIREACGAPDKPGALGLHHAGRMLRAVVREVAELRARVIAETEAQATAAEAAERAARAEHELEAARKAIRVERKSIAAREGALGARLRAAEGAADRATEGLQAQVTALEAEKVEQAAWAAGRIRDLEAQAKTVAAEHAKTLRQVEVEARKAEQRAAREAKADTAADLERARARIGRLEAALEKARAAPAPVAPPVRAAAPREPLLAALASGARSVTSHRARLAGWAAGEGADVEAARMLAVVVRDEAAPAEVRLRAQTALAGLLGGVR
jgi:chromosome segregation ATPase